jgi:hypothetical protein
MERPLFAAGLGLFSSDERFCPSEVDGCRKSELQEA